jgi:prepilin-type N-terminal cleavage/methylation domain-containing protein
MRKKTKIYKGFTLVEILLVMLITSIMVLGINGAFSQVKRIWTEIEIKKENYQNIRVVLETMRVELSGLYMPKKKEEQQNENKENYFELINLPDGKTVLSFYTKNISWDKGLGGSKPAKVTYIFGEDEKGENILSRTEQLASGEKVISKESKTIMLKGLSDFQVSVLVQNNETENKDWQQEYETTDTPPIAIKISLATNMIKKTSLIISL